MGRKKASGSEAEPRPSIENAALAENVKQAGLTVVLDVVGREHVVAELRARWGLGKGAIDKLITEPGQS